MGEIMSENWKLFNDKENLPISDGISMVADPSGGILPVDLMDDCSGDRPAGSHEAIPLMSTFSVLFSTRITLPLSLADTKIRKTIRPNTRAPTTVLIHFRKLNFRWKLGKVPRYSYNVDCRQCIMTGNLHQAYSNDCEKGITNRNF